RMKQVTVLTAQAQAEEDLVRQVKKAEADETASRHKAVEVTTLAQAELEAAGKTAEAKKKMAEAIEVERAAPGLADAKVREVTAAAIEREGLVQAKIIAEKLIAQAKGEEEKGLAEVRVIEAQADANEKLGLADAKVLEERLMAQARGEAQVGNTKAVVTRDVGQSEADVLRDKLFAEAKGLTEKFGALASLSDQARSHEEFRMQLEKNFEQALAAIEANKTVAQEQAEVLSAALSKANIDIVGGGGDFFNNFAKALSVGKAVEGVSAKSPIVQELLQKFIGGKGLPSDALSNLLGGGQDKKSLPPSATES
ncbi:MAG: hypothetical protein LBE58_16715, partial [Comamonas sp.]|nr:hypothetical protein [Comamonas sp.]